MNSLNVEHHYVDVGDSTVHYVTAGKGMPVVLLHGWPQTWYTWRKIIPELAENFHVIAPDLRGLGDSSRPDSGFDMKTVSGDVAKLLRDSLGIDKAYVVGHDWGGPAAFALAAFHPGLVTKLAMLDAAVPGDGSGSYSQNGKRWHHAFHQTLDLPEALIVGREHIYYPWFFKAFGFVKDAISEADVNEYMRTYRDFSTLRTGLAYYRSVPQDIIDNQNWLQNNKLQMPVLAYGGGEAMGRGEEGFTSLQRVSVNVRGGVVKGCGHWMQEEQPEFVLSELQKFFSE